MKSSLAFDFGATSIRAILGTYKDGKFTSEEVMRLSHERVNEDGRARWQFERLLEAVSSTILKYKDEVESIGVNTWGVDFGVVGQDGALLESPVSYRDDRHIEGYEEALKQKSAEEIFLLTGNQIMSINTLFQLLVLKKDQRCFDRIAHVLMLPDLINYFLTGNMCSEMTIASTTQLFDLNKKEFSPEIIKTYGLQQSFFPPVVKPGYVVGSTKNSKLAELRDTDIKVIATASHDTANAVLMTQAFDDKYTAFLSCGTWSLIGAITDKPIITSEAFAKSLTNETGFDGCNMFFKNITGLYIIEMLKKQLEEKYGRSIEFAEINDYVQKSELTFTVDVENAAFAQNSFDVQEVVNQLLGQKLAHDFDYFKVIYMSLVHKYKETLESIEEILGYRFTKIHMIGGGVKSDLICQLIVQTLKKDLVCGPMEATAMGNILVQKLATGEFSTVEEGKQAILASDPIKKIMAN